MPVGNFLSGLGIGGSTTDRVIALKDLKEPVSIGALETNLMKCPAPQMITSMGITCKDNWGWDMDTKSDDVRLFGPHKLTAHFHPNWSNGTAGIRGQRILNPSQPSRFYWEVKVSDRIFGTSMMFGVGTKKGRLHADSFVNLIGEDGHGWGLSHKGMIWHDCNALQFTRPFAENKCTTIGLLYDGMNGTLTYFKDGINLGVAFSGLDNIQDPLYPLVSSTAAKTEMTLTNTLRDYTNLQDRCREVISDHLPDTVSDLKPLSLPPSLECFIQQERRSIPTGVDVGEAEVFDTKDHWRNLFFPSLEHQIRSLIADRSGRKWN